MKTRQTGIEIMSSWNNGQAETGGGMRIPFLAMTVSIAAESTVFRPDGLFHLRGEDSSAAPAIRKIQLEGNPPF
jgi:hypothetical protein